jgi:hypothetical protein
VTHTRGGDRFTGAVQYQKINVHNHALHHAYGLLGQWPRYIDEQRQVTVYGQLTRLNYDGAQESQDADRHILGATYSQSFTVVRSAQAAPEMLVEKVSLPPLEAPQAISEREMTGSTVIFNEQVNEYGHADVFHSCSNCSSAP